MKLLTKFSKSMILATFSSVMKAVMKLRKPVFGTSVATLVLAISSVSVMNMTAPKPLTGYQVTVDGQVWGIFEDEKMVEQTFCAYKERFLKNVEADDIVLNVEFDAKIEIEEVVTPTNVYNSLEVIFDQLHRKKDQAVYYTVQPGDSIWAIAARENVPIATIMTYNPELDVEKIWPNDEIMIESEVPFIDVVVTLETVEIEEVAYETEFIKDNSLFRNQRVVVKPGVEGEKEVTYNITYRNGYPDDVEIIQEVPLKEPVTSVVRIGTMATLRRLGGNNFGVVVGRLSSGFGNRRDPFTKRITFHNGIDISAPRGTPIKAYTDGKVVKAGWDGMGGNMVVIDHGNGLRTEYAHMSSIGVRVGQYVSIGQTIGRVGATGYATGNHLHFSVRVNGKYVNPFNYI
ncbi:MAG: M23 family metallopeptidase [Erysipelothrix sp.]|jgi:murein DD-endopeptidase MepM/ murein hydrolase activator NlpD|nr:M23 family metallopeptidase [Erysipelothrix sp.]